MDLSVSYIYGEALDLTKKYGFRVLGLMLLLSVVVFATMFLLLPSGFWADPTHVLRQYMQMLPAFAVVAILGVFLYVGYYVYLIAIARDEPVTILSAYKQSPLTYVKYFVVQLLSMLVIVVGCMLFLFPGVYLGVRLIWASYHVLEAPECGIFEAFQWSWQKTDGQFLTLFGLFLVSFGLNIGVTVLFNLLSIVVGTAGSETANIIFMFIQLACTLFLAVYINIAHLKTFVTLSDGENYNECKY